MNAETQAVSRVEESPQETVAAERSNILIVDDRSDKRELDVILMDIMMPELDGLDTMREIRKIPRCKDLPIVAVTAKAMKGDREKCIEAGASDYISKPVDTERLLTLLRSWLHR